MPPSMMPETSSCRIVLIAPAVGFSLSRRKLALRPIRQRDHCDLVGSQILWIDLSSGQVLPLPDANRGADVLACILWIVRQIEIRELQTAAINQAAGRKVHRQGGGPHVVGRNRFGLRQDVVEQRPERRERGHCMAGWYPVLNLLVALVELLGGRLHLR